jgi:hypothetical protein
VLASPTLKTLVFCKCALSQIYGAGTCGTRTHLKRIQACRTNIVGSRHRRVVGYGTQTRRNKPVVGERRDQRGSVEATC